MIDGDGAVWCRGWNIYGTVGNGCDAPSGLCEPVETFSQVVGFDGTTASSSATELSAGQDHFCAIAEDGSVRCWGSNWAGQLGNGSTTNSGTPVAANLFGSASALASTQYATCALLSDGTVDCWGSPSLGFPGVDGVTTVGTDVAFAGRTAAVVLSDGSVVWDGDNYDGMQGDGTLSDAVEVGIGWQHTCVRHADGAVRCAGLALDGSGQTSASHEVALSFDGTAWSATDLVAADWENCAIRQSDQAVVCWGYDIGYLHATGNAMMPWPTQVQ